MPPVISRNLGWSRESDIELGGLPYTFNVSLVCVSSSIILESLSHKSYHIRLLECGQRDLHCSLDVNSHNL